MTTPPPAPPRRRPLAEMSSFEYNGIVVQAHTTGEARARLKEALRIPRNSRLPVGALVKRFERAS